MAVIALIIARDVGRMFTGCGNPIVTGATSAEDLSVVDSRGGHKSYGAMAVLADVCRLHVNRTLANGGNAVMAGNAIADYASMIENGR